MTEKLTNSDWKLWRDFLFCASQITTVADTQLQREHQLSLSDFDVLATLLPQDNQQMPVSELKKSVLVTKSGLSRSITRLEQKGWVEKTASQEDRRRQLLQLTAAGKAQLEAARASHLALVDELFFSALPAADRQSLKPLIYALKNHLLTN